LTRNGHKYIKAAVHLFVIVTVLLLITIRLVV